MVSVDAKGRRCATQIAASDTPGQSALLVMTQQLNLILNGKGSVGKSFFAVNLVQCLKAKDILFVAIDSDSGNSTLKRFHPEARFMDLSDPRDMDGM